MEVTHLKLQKLAYYAQGFHLAFYDESIFLEEIVAWDRGPVVPSLWRFYKPCGEFPINPPSTFDVSLYKDSHLIVLDTVFSRFGRYNPFALAQKTHKESPWKNAYPQGVITCDVMRTYFKSVLISNTLMATSASFSTNHQVDSFASDIYSLSVADGNKESVESDIKESKGFKAYLASKKKHYEVYRRLAES